MAVLASQAILAANTGFRDRVYVSMVAAGIAVAGEAQGVMSGTVYGKRQNLALAVLSNPLSYLERFAIGAAANSTIGADVFPPTAIASSTAANPSVITTAAAHSLSTGDTVQILGHAVNTAVNGQWTATVLTTTTFSVPTLGNGIGLASGTVTKQPSDANITNFGPFSQWNKFAGVTALD